jgi:hexulose-6-phosphate isomerase
MNRRSFLASSAAVAFSSGVVGHSKRSSAFSGRGRQDVDLSNRIYKTLKYNMVGVEGSLSDKFKAAKAAGFAAIELDSPLRFTSKDATIEAVNKAVKESGLPVDGTVCGSHWKLTHSSPDAEMRAAALKDLTDAIEQTDAVGGNSVLLVAGHGKDGTPEEIDARAIENISKALPVAARHGVSIVIENVWNRMHYDHSGDSTQTADRLIKFVDAFNSPLIGMQFDVGNHWKYGSMGDWIRQLDKRIIKLDLKGFSRETGKFTKIGEGDVDWADVRKALIEINFYGFAAAEVGGGGMDRLKEVSANMDRVLALKSE